MPRTKTTHTTRPRQVHSEICKGFGLNPQEPGVNTLIQTMLGYWLGGYSKAKSRRTATTLQEKLLDLGCTVILTPDGGFEVTHPDPSIPVGRAMRALEKLKAEGALPPEPAPPVPGEDDAPQGPFWPASEHPPG